jgi:rhodanese-related sulfurtransferase
MQPNQRIILVCASGARASLAALTLKDMGYEDVAVLDGGLNAWMAAGLPTIEPEYSGI